MRLDKYLKISRLIKRRIIEIKMGEKILKAEVLQVLEHALKNDAVLMYKILS